MTGLFAERSWNEAGNDGAFYGRPIQIWYQIAGILTAIGNEYFQMNTKFSSHSSSQRFCWCLYCSYSSSIEIYNWNSFITGRRTKRT